MFAAVSRRRFKNMKKLSSPPPATRFYSFTHSHCKTLGTSALLFHLFFFVFSVFVASPSCQCRFCCRINSDSHFQIIFKNNTKTKKKTFYANFRMQFLIKPVSQIVWRVKLRFGAFHSLTAFTPMLGVLSLAVADGPACHTNSVESLPMRIFLLFGNILGLLPGTPAPVNWSREHVRRLTTSKRKVFSWHLSNISLDGKTTSWERRNLWATLERLSQVQLLHPQFLLTRWRLVQLYEFQKHG